jgi:hypothetical protein
VTELDDKSATGSRTSFNAFAPLSPEQAAKAKAAIPQALQALRFIQRLLFHPTSLIYTKNYKQRKRPGF